ncbi:hypothetical protein [Blastopirellula marina]|uniref:Uncharacterized protein n=1 Tax=Blastopirellula marina DSM 3645 TaxID=314230 RepID=A3ZPI3_9BACT|nr:hypothetical protein [Blastopirellula marina]EAQ81661.1 hypothetical protein DSM3645_28807 [Blastopirellula marina DSM 3645]
MVQIYDKNSKKVLFGFALSMWVIFGGLLFLYGLQPGLYFISIAVFVISIPLLIFLVKGLGRTAVEIGSGIQKQVEFIEKQFKDEDQL